MNIKDIIIDGAKCIVVVANPTKILGAQCRSTLQRCPWLVENKIRPNDDDDDDDDDEHR